MALKRFHESERTRYYSPERLRRMIAQELHEERKKRRRKGYAVSARRARQSFDKDVIRVYRRTRTRRER